MNEAWAAEAARSIAEQPIFLTWNFFLTAIGLPALGWFLARLIKTRDELNEQNLALWQEGAKERNKAVTEKLERIEKCIASIKGDLKEKVDNGHCHERHEAVKSDINDLKARIWT
jgi:hypothetical protein